MRIGITHRLFWTLLAAAALAVATMVIIMQWSVGNGFFRYVNSMEKAGAARLATTLAAEYRTEHTWQFFVRDPSRWQKLIVASFPSPPPFPDAPPPSAHSGPGPMPGHPAPPMPPHFLRSLEDRLFLLDTKRTVVVGRGATASGVELTPIQSETGVAGYLGLVPLTRPADDHQLRFIKEQRYALLLVALLLVLLAAGISLPLARRLVQPLRALAKATHRMVAGDFTTRVPVNSDDELGKLAVDFNTLAMTLEKNEQARRQWVADISHELRTPVSVLRGEIEAMQDGIRQPTLENIHSLHTEVLRLGLLIGDLHQLAMTDLGALTYRKQQVDLSLIIAEALECQQLAINSCKIRLTTDLPKPGTALISGDPARLHQLFANLLGNSLKYTDVGGELKISMAVDLQKVSINFMDSAPGVAPEELERLFERLYRVEASRNRSTGGAGLGLSICKNIVDAHDGSIVAHPSELGGLLIRIELPLEGGA
jgi:two-component system sensor histidine kinase BaeS